MADEQVAPKRRRRQQKSVSNSAAREIDARLAEALRERTEAVRQVAKLSFWQGRLASLEQEINSLIGYQQKLTGQPITSVSTPAALVPGSRTDGAGFSHVADISGVSSIPSKQKRISPSSNVADSKEVTEGGFQ